MRAFASPLSVLVALLVALLAGGCGSGPDSGSGSDPGSSSDSGTRITIDGDAAVRWGDGDYGVILAHGAAFDAASWAAQATAIADGGATAIAVEDISPDAIRAAVEHLHEDGVARVALVGGSAGSDAILQLAAASPDLPDQLVLLSPNGVVDGLGSEPKLFIASEDEPIADVSRRLAAAGPGDDNRLVLVPGSAHAQNIFATDQGPVVLQTILDRLAQ